MRAFSLNDMMINGAPEHGHNLAIHLPELRTLVNHPIKIHIKNLTIKVKTKYSPECKKTESKQLTAASHHRRYCLSRSMLVHP